MGRGLTGLPLTRPAVPYHTIGLTADSLTPGSLTTELLQRAEHPPKAPSALAANVPVATCAHRLALTMRPNDRLPTALAHHTKASAPWRGSALLRFEPAAKRTVYQPSGENPRTN